MKYRKMGSLDWEVSALGFGAMRLPSRKFNRLRAETEASVKLIRHGIDLGINYIAAGDMTLHWNPVDGATIYRVEINTMPIIYTSDTETIVNLPEGSYSWSVRARRHDLYGWWTSDFDYESRSAWENFSVVSSE